MLFEPSEAEDLRSRLASSELSDDDVRVLMDLIAVHERAADEEAIGGRPVVGRLPFGISVIGERTAGE